MIYLVVGEDSSRRSEEIARIVGERTVRNIDGDSLEVDNLATLLLGQTIFDGDQVTVINGLTGNKAVWNELAAWLERDIVSDLVLSEPTVDKRQSVYKKLQSKAQIIHCDPWTVRDRGAAENWLRTEVRSRDMQLDDTVIREIIRRAIRPSTLDGKLIIDRVRIMTVLGQIGGWQGSFDLAELDTVMYPSGYENVFSLLAIALDGDKAKLAPMLTNLRQSEDGFRVFGLLASQILNLLALVYGHDRTVEQVASDLKQNPFALRSLAQYRRHYQRKDVEQFAEYTGEADQHLKSGADPWIVVELLVNKIANYR